MSDITLTRVAAPNAPAVDKAIIYVDTADRRVKAKDDNGVISVLSPPDGESILTNGGFQIQQRVAQAATAIPGATTTTRAGQVADRWAVTTGNTTTVLWTRVDSGAAVETALNAKFYGRITQNTNAAKFILSQFLVNEQMAHLRGSKVRLSCKIKNFAGSNANYRLGLLQLTAAGTIDVCPAFISAIGGASVEPTWGTNLVAISPDTSPTGENGTISGVALTIASTANWVRSSAVFTIPLDAKNLCAVLYRDTIGGVSDSLGVAEIQMTQGTEIIDWRSPEFDTELARCQRYYCKTFAQGTVPVQNAGVNTGELKWVKVVAGATAGRMPTWNFPRPMWKTPVTVTTYNPAVANAQVRDQTNAVDCTVTTIVGSNDRQTALTFTGNAATVAEGLMSVHITADAELVA